MSSEDMPSVVFFGSGPVAAKSLECLLQTFRIETVITRPRPAHHRGSVPVIELCETKQLPYHAPATKLELSHLFATTRFTSPLGLVIDYGLIIEQSVIDSFPLGIVNSHFSLLPEWRGADPISFAILSGQPKTGVSLMLINDKMDEGPILAQAELPLESDIATPQLTDQLIELSNSMLGEILPLYTGGQLQAVPQQQLSSRAASYSRKLTKADGQLDWHKPAEDLEREIRAFADWPKSHTTIAGKEVIITAGHLAGTSVDSGSHTIGTAFQLPDGQLGVATGQGVLLVDRLKPAGKADMTAAAFLNGYGKNL